MNFPSKKLFNGIKLFCPCKNKCLPTRTPHSSYISEYITVYNSHVEYMKLSIKCMLIANGGAITTVLVKFKDDNMFYPLLIFSFGVAYTIFVPIIMYIKSKNNLEYACKKNLSPFDCKLYKKIIKLCIDLFTTFIIYIPALIFLYGIIVTEDIILNKTVRHPSEILDSLIKSLQSLV